MVGTMIAATVFGLTAGTFAYAAVAFAANFALSYVITRTFGSNRAPNQIDPGSRQQIPPSANNAIPVVYGDAWLGGTFVDAVLSTDNKTMYYVLAISNISPDGQFSYDRTKFYYGDRLVTFDGTDPTKVVSLTDGAGNVDTKISGNLYISLYTSTQAGVITNVTGSAPSVVMGGSDITPSLRWPSTPTRQMNGLAFAIVKLTYNSEAGTTGLQPITFKVSHYLNSAGAARPGDVLRDYLTSDVYGCAVPLANVNTTACTALNTYSDQVITFEPYTGGSSTQPRYRINGVLNTGEAVLNNINKILTACDSWLAYQETTGQWMPIINKAESTAFAFDDSNIIGELRVSISDITQSINQVEATFPWKENKDQPNLVYLETPSGLMYPNEPANKATVTFDLVNDSVQAQYLANRMLEQAREDLIVTFSTAYTGIQVDAGDVISITNSDYGWNAKLFRVTKVSETSLPDGNLGAQIECNEYNAAVYDDQNIKQFTPAPNSGLNSAYFFSALSAPTVSDQLPSAAVPSFSVTCNVPSTGRVTSITLYYTTSATPSASDWKVWGTEFSSDSQAFTPSLAFKFTNVSLPAGTYYFAFKVANDVATSQLSTVSSALVWTPAANIGPTGPTGGSGPTGSTGPTGTSGPTGAGGTQQAIAYLYQWATTQPGNPSGTSTWTWATGTNSGYTGGNGWSTTLPVNPGTPGLYLWVASKAVTDTATATTTTVSWASGFQVVASSSNGVNGSKTARPTVYQWAATIPTISGTSTYTWSTGNISPAPSGWSTSITTSPSAGFTLWAATVNLLEADSATTSTINWTTASILAAGYAGITGPTGSGTAGASARICFARVSNNPAPVAGNITTTGSSSFPSSAQSLATWGFSATWVASDPDPTSTNSLYQSDGIYNPTTGNTVWSTPYISSLKVGTLSAITVNTGALTVQDTLTMSTLGKIRGGQTDYNTGTGFFLGYSGAAYKFSIGSTAASLLWDGSSLSLTGSSSISISGSASFSGTTSTPQGNMTLYAVSTTGTAINGYANNTAFAAGVRGFHAGTDVLNYGVWGSGGSGVRGDANGTNGYGGYFQNTVDSTKALYAAGKITATGQIETTAATGTAPLVVSSTTVVPNLTVQRLQSTINTSVLSLRTGIAAGGSTATFNNTNKPGVNNTTNTWLEITVDGTIYLIPVWTA
jgi:hypothetical protein